MSSPSSGHHASMRVTRCIRWRIGPSDDDQPVGVDRGTGNDSKHDRIEPKGEAVTAQERRPQNWLFWCAPSPGTADYEGPAGMSGSIIRSSDFISARIR